MEPSHTPNRPPRPVREVAKFLWMYSIGLASIGIIVLIGGFATQFNTLGGAAVLLALGIGLGMLAWQFYRLRRWTFPIVRFLVSSWWGLRGAAWMGVRSQFNTAEVRSAFGLPPAPEDRTKRPQR